MKVAMLQACLPPAPAAGGVGYQVHLLSSELVRRGHDITAYVVDEPKPDGPYECISVAAPRGRASRILGIGVRFARLDLSSFDVVHAHGDDWWFRRRPRARTFYGSALMEARTATDWRRRAAQACYYGLEWLSSANAHSVAISEATLRYLPLVRRVVPCAYDPHAFFPGTDRRAEPSILFVAGSLAGRKRGHLLLEAFEAVRRSFPEARLTIVSQDHVDHEGVTCLSNVDASTLGDLYRSHWVLCSTSAYEGFGVPYIEALASGLPVVATPNSGAAEVLQNGDLGVLAPPEHLATALVTLLRDERTRQRLASRGIQAAKRYSVESVAAVYEELYSEVAAESRRRPGPGTSKARHP